VTVGKPGRKAVREFISRLSGRRDVHLVVANAENAAGGMITESAVLELFDAGVDALTGGNHIWDKREGVPLLQGEARILRPANNPPGAEGRGWGVFRGRSGAAYAVVSLIGRVFMGQYDCPFRWMDGALPEVRRQAGLPRRARREAAMAFHLDGRVAAIAGTHTHVQTVDAQVLPGGTGYITDAGMCGASPSVIGMDPKGVLRRFLLQVPTRFEVAAGEPEAAGVFFDIDAKTGSCRTVEPFVMSESRMRSADEWKRFSSP
jgi:hypothetical protein